MPLRSIATAATTAKSKTVKQSLSLLTATFITGKPTLFHLTYRGSNFKYITTFLTFIIIIGHL